MQTWKENLLFQFSVVSFVVMALLAVSLSVILANSARERVLDEAAAEARDVVSHRVVRHLSPQDLAQPLAGERLQAFHRFVAESVVSERTARVKLWSGQTVLYSDDFSQIGDTYPMSNTLAKALKGGIAREISVPQKAENERERFMGTLIEVYTPIVFPGSQEVAGVFEIYQYYAPYAEFIATTRRIIFTATFAGFGILYLALFFVVARGWHTIKLAQQRVQRSLQETKGLNNLLLGYLDQRQHLIDQVQELGAQATQAAHSDPSLRQFNETLLGRLKQIAEEARQFPRPPSTMPA